SKEKVKRGMELTLGEALEERSRMEKVHKINNNLQVILTGVGKLITADKPEGEDISTLTTKYNVKDFDKNNNVFVDDPDTITEIYNGVGGAGATITEILDHAKSFLNKALTIKMTPANSTTFKETALMLYNDRR
ncbi:15873_t:CDS:1, partial [Funneliformis geosporum]